MKEINEEVAVEENTSNVPKKKAFIRKQNENDIKKNDDEIDKKEDEEDDDYDYDNDDDDEEDEDEEGDAYVEFQRKKRTFEKKGSREKDQAESHKMMEKDTKERSKKNTKENIKLQRNLKRNTEKKTKRNLNTDMEADVAKGPFYVSTKRRYINGQLL